jgi:anti-sigma factor RsiW
MEPHVDCSKAQTLLSDLLDVRRGEQPSPHESPLGNPQTLKAVEQHLAQCDVCTQELRELEEVGLAFSEFNLEEREASHFAGYGRMVNERVGRMTQRTAVRPVTATPSASMWRTWVSTVAASAAAAVLAVVLLSPRGETTTPAGIPPEKQRTAEADTNKVSTLRKVEPVVSEGSLLDELVGPIDVPKLDPRRMDLDVRTRNGGLQRVTLDPRAEKKSPSSVFSESAEPFFLSEPLDNSRNTGLVGIMFKATGKEDPAEGLCVVAVKRGGPADSIGLRPDDRLLALNGVAFSASTSEEIIKFFNAVSNLGGGKPVQVDYATKDRAGDWIVKRGRAVLGRFQ